MQFKYALVALIAAASTSASPLPVVEDIEIPCPNDSSILPLLLLRIPSYQLTSLSSSLRWRLGASCEHRIGRNHQ